MFQIKCLRFSVFWLVIFVVKSLVGDLIFASKKFNMIVYNSMSNKPTLLSTAGLTQCALIRPELSRSHPFPTSSHRIHFLYQIVTPYGRRASFANLLSRGPHSRTRFSLWYSVLDRYGRYFSLPVSN